MSLPINRVKPSAINIAIGSGGVLTAKEIDVIIANDSRLFLARLINFGQLVLGRIGLNPVESFINRDQYITAEIRHIGQEKIY